MRKFFLPLVVLATVLFNSQIFSQSDFDISIRQLDNPHNISADYIEGLIVVEYTPGAQGKYLSLGAISSDFMGPFDIIVENLYLPSQSEVDTNRYTVSTMCNLANIGVEALTNGGENRQQSFTEFVLYIHLLNSIGFYPFAESTFYGEVVVALTVLQVYAINMEFLVSQLLYAPVEPVEQPEEDERTLFINRTNYSNLDLDNSRNPGVDGGYAGDLNACVPAATANSMRWLERNNKIEFTGDASKYKDKPYEVLESLSGHMKREKEKGTTRENMVRGKLDFIGETKIPLSVKFQSHYIDSAQITSSNKNSVAQNFRREGDEWPDWEFLKQMMKDGEDIEMNYHWEAEDGKWYGHSVFVNGLEEFESGKKKISFSHDRVQGRANKDNGDDDIGTYRETYEVSIDTNGAMRFGPENKNRVHTIAAESPHPPEGSATAAFLNEFFALDGDGFNKKNNSISVDNEFIEIGLGLGVGELDLYEIHIYDSNGNIISKSNLSDFEVSASEEDYQFYLLNFPSDQLPADKGGIAISYSGTLIPGQYFSYGGEILAQDGIAMNLVSNNVGDLIAGQSIGLQGVGENYTEFSYDYSSNPTPGEVNDGQIFGDPTSVDEQPTPKEYELSQNFPNPFNPSTLIKFGLPEKQHVKLIVYDLLGREVSILIDKSLTAGYHRYELIADNLSSGVYIYRIIAGDFVESKKFIILK